MTSPSWASPRLRLKSWARSCLSSCLALVTP
ncbi:UNVERIFIED_CONTAM: hypothetical protein GTU68_043590 [Idotea baltica]|nr:hypothetical protein [Idotea baltica]